MAVGRMQKPGEPGPFSGNSVIFGVAPRTSSSASLAGAQNPPASTSTDEEDDMQGKSAEAQSQYQRALLRLLSPHDTDKK